MAGDGLVVFVRFRVAESDVEFRRGADKVVEHWLACAGCRSARLVRNVDEPELWALASEWDDVGSYRRSFAGYDAKLLLTPLLGRAVDEPSAYLSPEDASTPRWRGTT